MRSMLTSPKRGEIHYVDFSPAHGKEIKGVHPALIIQNDVANEVSQLTIVAAITSTLKVAKLPVGVEILPQESGLGHRSAIHLGQIYTIDQRRLQKRVGRLPKMIMNKIDEAMQVSLGLRKFRFS